MFHKLPFQFATANALCSVMHFTGWNPCSIYWNIVIKIWEIKNSNTNINSNWQVIAKVSERFHVNLWLMNYESVPWQTLYVDFEFTVLFFDWRVIIKLDYDKNMGFKGTTCHLELFRIQHYNHSGLQDIFLHQCKYSLKVRNLSELLQ